MLRFKKINLRIKKYDKRMDLVEAFLNTTTTLSPFTTTSSVNFNDQVPSYVGFIVLSISVLFFGSNYLPVKAFETGDGMFFQLILTSGIWCVGFAVHCIQGFPPMYPLAMLGGVFWFYIILRKNYIIYKKKFKI